MLRFRRVLVVGLVFAMAAPAVAQQTYGQDEDGNFNSPVPRVKVIRPVEAETETGSGVDSQDQQDQQVATQQGSDDPVVLTTDQEGTSAADEDATPNDGSSVRVVFGGSSINQNVRLREDQDAEESDQDDDESHDAGESRVVPRSVPSLCVLQGVPKRLRSR